MEIIKRFYQFISSMKAGLVLMGTIGLMSAVGSVFLPQTFFRTSVFKILLLLLLINMALCTLNQLAGYTKRRPFKENNEKKSRYLMKNAAIIILHAGVVCILIGGTMNSFYGVREEVTIIKGGIADLSWMDKSAIPFGLRLDEFEIEYYPDGSVSQYYSYVSLMEGNETIKQDVISVNYPLKYKGIKAYLSNYAYEPDAEWPHVLFIIKTDPGLPLASLGGLMLVVGVCLSFIRGTRT